MVLDRHLWQADEIGDAWNLTAGPTYFCKTNNISLHYIELGENQQALFFFIPMLLIIEWIGRAWPHPLAHLFAGQKRWPLRYMCYYLIIIMIILFAGQSNQFIYFQF
jgi:Ca2+/H+ antiporter